MLCALHLCGWLTLVPPVAVVLYPVRGSAAFAGDAGGDPALGRRAVRVDAVADRHEESSQVFVVEGTNNGRRKCSGILFSPSSSSSSTSRTSLCFPYPHSVEGVGVSLDRNAGVFLASGSCFFFSFLFPDGKRSVCCWCVPPASGTQ